MPDPTNTTSTSVADILQSNNLGTTAENVERVFRETPVGEIGSAIGNNLFGINHRQTPGLMSINKDHFGMTFFTRPRLNLTTENIRAVREFTPLLTNEPASFQRTIRCLLDPQLGKNNVASPFTDRQQAFIPVLTNNLLSISGWPDVILPFSTSQEGVYKEAFSMADGLTKNYSTYTLTANFRNLSGDPITLLFLTWIHYMSLVYQGIIVPYPDMIVENEIDYMTRIYRLVLNSSKTHVQKIAACGASFPVNVPIGAAFNFETETPYNQANGQLSVSFQAMGAIYQDDILIDEFNRTVVAFNGGMDDSHRDQYYKMASISQLGLFNTRGYPRINPDTYALEWWIANEDFNYYLPNG